MQRIRRALCLWASVLVVPEATALPMQGLLQVMWEAQEETLLSARCLQLMAAVAVAAVQALLRLIPEGAEVASGQKVLRPVIQERTARAAVVTAARQQA